MQNISRLSRLKNLVAEVVDMNRMIALLNWDLQTNMPPGGVESRAAQIQTLSRISHSKFTSKETGDLCDELRAYGELLAQDSDDACFIRAVDRLHSKKVKTPSSLVADTAKAAALSQKIWREARDESDFKKFLPHLETVVDLRKQYAAAQKPWDSPYDPLLDDFEPGMKTLELQFLFGKIKPRLIEAARTFRAAGGRGGDSLLNRGFDEEPQRLFTADVLTRCGFDWKAGRMDRAERPFTAKIGAGDVRITVNFKKNDFAAGFFAALHEGGHALYEQGIAPSLAGTPLDEGASLALHESQAALWENLVGRSYPFWIFFYPRLKNLFPAALRDLSLDDFHREINRLSPAMRRAGSDELTGNLHVILRFEIELALIEGSASPSDIPELWRSKMVEFFGEAPRKDAEGALQDVHWSCGMFGYFPSRALGCIIAAQLWESMHAEEPGIPAEMEAGHFETLSGWLRKNIYSRGAKHTPGELIRKVTGAGIDPAPYTRYLSEKYLAPRG
jgi:carboxypeptidase Taq